MHPSTAVPTIHIGPFLDGDAQAQAQIANQVAQTCEQTGFLIISGHRFPSGLFETATQQLFDFSICRTRPSSNGTQPALPSSAAFMALPHGDWRTPWGKKRHLICANLCSWAR